jgi:flagellar biosynthetic protein FliQ
MTPETIMDLAHQALIMTGLIAAPMLIVSLLAGLVIGMLQAATQIHEATLSFIPKMLLLVWTLFAVGPWMIHMLMDFTREIYARIPAMVG